MNQCNPPLRARRAGAMLKEDELPTVEERVASLEQQMNDLLPIRDALVRLERRVDAGFESMDRRFEAMERRFEAVERRFDGVDHRFETIDHRFEAMNDRMARQFMWLAGVQVTTLAAIVAAFFGSIAAFLPR